MAFWDKEESLVTIDKNKSEKIEFKYCEKGDKKYIGLTFLKKNSEDEFKPIGGTTFPTDKWAEIKAAIDLKLTVLEDVAE
jgi:hypothetical protein